jgi:hypothetical protein
MLVLQNLRSSGMLSLDQEMKEMVTASPSRKGVAKNVFTRTARSVFSVLSRAHGDATDDDYSAQDSKDAYTYEYVSAVYCASDDAANEDLHSIDSAVAAVVSHDASDDMSEGSHAVDTTTATTNDYMDTESSDKSVGTAADEMESYKGDGHSPKNFEHEVKADGSWSRAIWAAARDDFDFIVEDSATSVSIARLRVASENHGEFLDPDKYLSLFGQGKDDRAQTPRRNPNDKSWRSISDEEEFDTLEEMRRHAWETGASFPEQQSGETLRI